MQACNYDASEESNLHADYNGSCQEAGAEHVPLLAYTDAMDSESRFAEGETSYGVYTETLCECKDPKSASNTLWYEAQL